MFVFLVSDLNRTDGLIFLFFINESAVVGALPFPSPLPHAHTCTRGCGGRGGGSGGYNPLISTPPHDAAPSALTQLSQSIRSTAFQKLQIYSKTCCLNGTRGFWGVRQCRNRPLLPPAPLLLYHILYTLLRSLSCRSCCRSCGGMGILVKEEFDPERPPQTSASFSLRNPDEVQSFLAMLVTSTKASSAS